MNPWDRVTLWFRQAGKSKAMQIELDLYFLPEFERTERGTPEFESLVIEWEDFASRWEK